MIPSGLSDFDLACIVARLADLSVQLGFSIRHRSIVNNRYVTIGISVTTLLSIILCHKGNVGTANI